jgi:hypothetical protein
MDDTALLAVIQGYLKCHPQQDSLPTFCARHPDEAWTQRGCPVAVRAAYRLSHDYHGTADEEDRLWEIISALQS